MNASNNDSNKITLPEQNEDFMITSPNIWQSRALKKAVVLLAVGATALGSLVVGGDYLAKRFGAEAGDAAFNAMNSQVQDAIINLENTAPDIIAKKVLPSAVCVFAAEHKISQKILKNQKISCPNYNSDLAKKK